jgi:hypothetical protein
MAVELDHLSYSSISSYLYCAASWKFHYLDKIPAPSTPPLVFGGAFHNTIEDFITQGVTKPEEPKTLEQIWLEKWKAATTFTNEETQKVSPRTDIDWQGNSPEFHCNEGLRMFTSNEVVDGILSIKAGQDEAGIKVERKVELKVPGVPVPIIGYIDIITDDGIPGDFKTSKTSWNQDKANAETQPLFYLAAMNQAGMETPNWMFRHYVFTKLKKPTLSVF